MIKHAKTNKQETEKQQQLKNNNSTSTNNLKQINILKHHKSPSKT